jgi:hypothetical protein
MQNAHTMADGCPVAIAVNIFLSQFSNPNLYGRLTKSNVDN